MNSQNKVERIKQRSVHNALVKTDDVKIKPGKNYRNWIPISRAKLQVKYIPHYLESIAQLHIYKL